MLKITAHCSSVIVFKVWNEYTLKKDNKKGNSVKSVKAKKSLKLQSSYDFNYDHFCTTYCVIR